MRIYPVMVAALGVLSAIGCSKPLEAPALRPDVGPGKAFSYMRPVGWTPSGQVAAGGNAGNIEFTHRGATIRIKGDLAGSLMGDILQSGNQQMEGLAGMVGAAGGPSVPAANPKPPVERLHDLQARGIAEQVTEFQDSGPAQALTHKLGEARVSEFTAKADGSKVRGLRATILGGEKRYTIRCQCSPNDWKTLEPTFRQIIDTLGPAPE